MTDRRTIMVPLTPEWFRVAMTPRHSLDGTQTYVLTPPSSGPPSTAGAWVRLGLWVLAFACAAAPWIVLASK